MPQNYRAFLIRGWLEGDAVAGEAACWRFSLEEIGGSGPRRGFASLDALCAMLASEMPGPQCKSAGDDDESDVTLEP